MLLDADCIFSYYVVKLVANQFLDFGVAAVCHFPLLMLVVYFALSWSVASEFLCCFFSCEFDSSCVLRTLCSM